MSSFCHCNLRSDLSQSFLTCFEQMFGYGHESVIASLMERRPAREVLDVDVGTGFDQFSHASQIVFYAGQMQLRLSLFVAFVQSFHPRRGRSTHA